jgi:hypothetical protein
MKKTIARLQLNYGHYVETDVASMITIAKLLSECTHSHPEYLNDKYIFVVKPEDDSPEIKVSVNVDPAMPAHDYKRFKAIEDKSKADSAGVFVNQNEEQ